MSVKKIFITLITIVACVILGAFVLNTLLPNVTANLINATEAMIHNATGMEFDFNADGITGSGGGKSFTEGEGDDAVNAGGDGAGVAGFA